MTTTSSGLRELEARNQWVVYKLVPKNNGTGKMDKVPYDACTDDFASSVDPSTWTSHANAEAAVRAGRYPGAGFVFSADDPYVGVDLDGCRNPKTGELEAWARDAVVLLNSYTEVSPSGTGVHIILKGTLPPTGRKRGAVEMYSEGRFFTVTGRHLAGTPDEIMERTRAINEFHAQIFPKRDEATPAPVPTPSLDDLKIVERATAARNGVKFSALWRGDWRGAGYPSQSEADMGLAMMLTFWTQDPAQVDRLFRQSGLYRAKWDERRGSLTYGQRTVTAALQNVTEVYSPGAILKFPKDEGVPPDAPQARTDDGAAPAPGTATTDLGNAERFILQHGRNVRFVPAWKTWLVWDGKRWRPDDLRAVPELAVRTVRSIYAEAASAGTAEGAAALGKHARASEADARIKAMLSLAEGLPGVAVRPDVFDTDLMLLNVRNGTVNLRDGTLREHRREDMITKICPAPYEPDATAGVWLAFLSRVMGGNEDMIAFLKRAVGYSVTGQTGEECMFFLHGTGRNGKSKLLGAVEHVLGDYAQSTRPETFTEVKGTAGAANPDLADLAGIRYAPTIETAEGGRIAEALLKWATGGDVIRARQLFQNLFSFRPQFKLWLAGNHKPEITGTDDGIWSRIRLIPFTVTIPTEERDRNLAAKLEAEAAGILAWAIEGCIEWQIHGLGEPKEVEQATAQYREEMDPIGGFLADCCMTGPAFEATVKALFASYEAWCGQAGEQPMHPKEFGKRLREHGFVRRKSAGNVWWRGLRLAME